MRGGKPNQQQGALLTTAGLALTQPCTVHTERRHKDLWDHRVMQLSQVKVRGGFLEEVVLIELRAHRH